MLTKRTLMSGLTVAIALSACGGDDEDAVMPSPLQTSGCSSVTAGALSSSDATVSIAQAVTAGPFVPPGSTTSVGNMPHFCRVAALLKPSPDSAVNVEFWLPESWNGKLVSVGNGGLAGTISYADMAPALAKGYATVSTDTGHTATDLTWLPNKTREYEYMTGSIHAMTVAAKSLVQRYYGRSQSRAYYQGCSTGGGQAFSAVQRFPDDYDGVIAGAPQNFPTHFRAALLNNWLAANATPESVLPAATMANVTKAILNQCGQPQEVTDGFLLNPQACTFDPAKLQCAPGQSDATCLTPAQIDTVKTVYGGLRSAKGTPIWPGLFVGSEAGWQAQGTAGGAPFATSSNFFRIGVLQDPNYDLKKIDLESAIKQADGLFSDVLNSISTNIAPFTSKGGKLLMYHGWSDNLISPQNSINYYETLVEQSGSRSQTENSTRLFMVPGMGHCSGGPGATSFDTLTSLDNWVETNQAPPTLTATSTSTPAFTRPLCPYPQVAEYKGAGDRNTAANWQCTVRPAVADTQFYRRGLNVFN
jgi:feruloyl esterase